MREGIFSRAAYFALLYRRKKRGKKGGESFSEERWEICGFFLGVGWGSLRRGGKEGEKNLEVCREPSEFASLRAIEVVGEKGGPSRSKGGRWSFRHGRRAVARERRRGGGGLLL